MTLPEQLSFDFSVPMNRAQADPPGQVIVLERYRQAREAQRMHAIYDAILASISHIRIDRPRTDRAG